MSNSALRIVLEFGREVQAVSEPYQSSSREQVLLEQLAREFELQEQWVNELWQVANTTAGKQALQDKVEKIIRNAVNQTEVVEPTP